jgi:hypothetical protein
VSEAKTSSIAGAPTQPAVRAVTQAALASPTERLPSVCRVKLQSPPITVPLAVCLNSAIVYLIHRKQRELLLLVAYMLACCTVKD